MSETVHYKGKLKLIGEATEELCKEIYGEEITYQDSYREAVECDMDDYVVSNGKVYEIINKNRIDDYDICQ